MKIKHLISKLKKLDQELPIVGRDQEVLINIDVMATVSKRTMNTESYSLRNVVCEDWLRMNDHSDLENEY